MAEGGARERCAERISAATGPSAEAVIQEAVTIACRLGAARAGENVAVETDAHAAAHTASASGAGAGKSGDVVVRPAAAAAVQKSALIGPASAIRNCIAPCATEPSCCAMDAKSMNHSATRRTSLRRARRWNAQVIRKSA